MMKKPVLIIIFILAVSFFLVNASFALWSHEAEVKFTLNISQPQEEFSCGEYTTIQEGIDLLTGVKYDYIYDRMDQFEDELAARVIELNNLPYGGITLQELQEECDYYRKVVIAGFGDLIDQYGDCIDQLGDFYNSSSQEEKDQFPNYWHQEDDMLWDLHAQLWNKRQDLYGAVKDVWKAGEEKIDYNNGGNKGKP